MTDAVNSQTHGACPCGSTLSFETLSNSDFSAAATLGKNVPINIVGPQNRSELMLRVTVCSMQFFGMAFLSTGV